MKALLEGHFVLKNGIKIPISRRKEAEAKAWFFSLQ
ncbi:MAG: hypothetical protein IPL84_08745 [Chitinophagaceae bacterium]|nr:hypothetical protein [Chitinophagaceae bacterium]